MLYLTCVRVEDVPIDVKGTVSHVIITLPPRLLPMMSGVYSVSWSMLMLTIQIKKKERRCESMLLYELVRCCLPVDAQ